MDSSPSQLKSIDSSPSRIKSQTSVCQSTTKLFGSSPIQLESQVLVRPQTLKIFGSIPSRLKSSASVRRLSLKLVGSSPRRLSFDRRRNCWLTSQLSVPRPLQPLTTHVVDVCHLPITETNMSPIVCTTQNQNSNYVLIMLLRTYFITQWRLAILLVRVMRRDRKSVTRN